ncbi:anthranilate 1,2-dioxygenase ferredoxin subunit [bacterium BMS3Abin03]|nr:anthranilate 1,2-dioxygenase ferredoxin subunit [bacterium BMS3Abin03]
MNLIEDGFTQLCNVDELKNLSGKRFIVDDTEVALFKIDEKIYALNNICPHQHTALIYNGFIEDGCVTCPAHGWKFNLETGRKPSGSKGLNIYGTKLVEGVVYVKVIPRELHW